jgi:hypothetical protein
MDSPTGIIPDELIDARKLQEVIAWLVAQPLPGGRKRSLLQGWAMWTGVRLHAWQYSKVEKSGIDF